MATPTSSGTSTSAVFATGNTYLDALIGGSKWAGVVGTGAQLYFSFPQPGTSYWSTDPTYGYGPTSGDGEPWHSYGLTTAQQDAVRSALQQWANVANISFVETSDTSVSVGDIRISFTESMDEDTAGFAYYPHSLAPTGGDIWLNAENYFESFAPGTYSYQLLLHEIGHAIGLKHPFEVGDTGAILPAGQDDYSLTLMSYSSTIDYPDVALSYYVTTPMWHDIAVAQYLYGPNMSYHAGNDTYTFYATEEYFETIWDAGGIDTFVYVSSFGGGELDLRPGNWSQLGVDRTAYAGAFPYLSYADTVNTFFSVVIENAVGGNGPDTIIGNDVGNNLTGNTGADSILGGFGDDVIAGNEGNDTLRGGIGDDQLRGGKDQDFVYSGQGNDQVFGALGNDELRGGLGNDTIYAGQGNDALYGGAGNDELHGLLQGDTLTGGDGADVFVFETTLGAGNVDVITDFVSGVDLLYLDKDIFTAFASYVGGIPPTGYITYSQSSGLAYYDPDAAGLLAPIAFLGLGTGHPAPLYSDILIVS
jgi:serralysin